MPHSSPYVRTTRIENSKHTPCIFISHQRADTTVSRLIWEYIQGAGVTCFLDVLDPDMLCINTQGVPGELTAHLSKKITESTHMLCIVSQATEKSKWVPFEVGFAHARAWCEKTLIYPVALLGLSDLPEERLEDYMQAAVILRSITALNEYIAKIAGESVGELSHDKRLLQPGRQHPLFSYLRA